MPKPTIFKPDGETASTMSPAQLQCIDLLRQALASAEKGEVMAIALVACGPNDFGVAFGGADIPRLHLGLGVALRSLEEKSSPPVGAGRSVLHR